MKVQYTKYTIIEVVPVEIKSYKIPLVTFLNSFFLWIYLFWVFIKTSVFKKISPIKMVASKYSSKNRHNEIIIEDPKNENVEYKLMATEFNSKDDINRVQSSSIIYKKKDAKKLLKELLSDDNVIQYNVSVLNNKTFGSFLIREDQILFDTENSEYKNINGKKILTRSVSIPVKNYINFLNKYLKFYKFKKHL